MWSSAIEDAIEKVRKNIDLARGQFPSCQQEWNLSAQ